MSQKNFEFRNGINSNIGFKLVIFSFEPYNNIDVPYLRFTQADQTDPYNTLYLVIPEGNNVKKEYPRAQNSPRTYSYSPTSIQTKILIFTLPRLIFILVFLISFFIFHLDSNVRQSLEYPLQHMCFGYFLIWFGVLLQGFLSIQSFVINLLLSSAILVVGMIWYRKMNYLLRRNLPVLLLFTVYFESYAEVAENYDTEWKFTSQFFIVVAVVFLFAKIPTWFNALNNTKKSYNDEVLTSVLLSMRISMTMFEGYKPLRNPLEVGKLSKVL